jgi:hypothetical protein
LQSFVKSSFVISARLAFFRRIISSLMIVPFRTARISVRRIGRHCHRGDPEAEEDERVSQQL